MPANVQDHILIADPKTLEERRKVAEQFAAQFKVSLPILVDGIDDPIEKAYAAWPDRIYVIDAVGKIVYKGAIGPAGFLVADIPPILDRLLGTAPNPAAPQPPAAAALPSMRDRLSAALSRTGLDEKEMAAVAQAVEKKTKAYAAVMFERRRLMMAAQQQGDLTAAFSALSDAEKQYRQNAGQIDRNLDAAIMYSKKPAVLGVLTALGVIGEGPAAPFSGLMGQGERPGAFLRGGRARPGAP